jgi:hypothetical protein
MSGTEMQSLQGMMGGGATPTPGIGRIDPNKLSAQFGESDPMGMLAQPKPAMDPAVLQMMMSMRGMGGAGQGQGMQAPQGMPAPQVQPGALMGAMPQMPQGGYRPRGMAGRF